MVILDKTAEAQGYSRDLDIFWRIDTGRLAPGFDLEPHIPLLANGLTVAVCTYQRARALERFLDSLETQSQLPNLLLIIDASLNAETENLLKARSWKIGQVAYLHVSGNLKGLTRQRNVALDWCPTHLIVFFDDDIVLEPGCLDAMIASIQNSADIVGACAQIKVEDARPGSFWKSLRLLGAMPDLIPGKYHRSGLVAPLRLLGDISSDIDIGRLPGGCTAWRTHLARKERFNDVFSGYAQSEDLEFSLRMAKYGRLVVSCQAKVLHLHAEQGRPDQFRLGRMGVVNRFYIFSSTFLDRTWLDGLHFFYAQSLYVIFTTLSIVFRRGGLMQGANYMLGAIRGLLDCFYRVQTRWDSRAS